MQRKEPDPGWPDNPKMYKYKRLQPVLLHLLREYAKQRPKTLRHIDSLHADVKPYVLFSYSRGTILRALEQLEAKKFVVRTGRVLYHVSGWRYVSETEADEYQAKREVEEARENAKKTRDQRLRVKASKVIGRLNSMGIEGELGRIWYSTTPTTRNKPKVSIGLQFTEEELDQLDALISAKRATGRR